MSGLGDFLFNKSDQAQKSQVVDAPAFSLTKVLASGSVIVAPLATLLVDKLSDLDLKPHHWVALIIGLLGFLAVTAAADVLARSLATAAAKNAEAAAAGIAQFIRFQDPLAAHQGTGTTRSSVEVLAVAHAGQPYFLVKDGDSIKWEPQSGVTIP
jgi:hypothetical protein